MANRLRGERKLSLFGKEYILRPDHQSIMEIEDAADGETCVITLFRQSYVKSHHTLNGTAYVIYGCLKASGVNEYTLDQVIREVRRIGIAHLVKDVGILLAAMADREEVEEEVKPELGTKLVVSEERKSPAATTG